MQVYRVSLWVESTDFQMPTLLSETLYSTQEKAKRAMNAAIKKHNNVCNIIRHDVNVMGLITWARIDTAKKSYKYALSVMDVK